MRINEFVLPVDSDAFWKDCIENCAVILTLEDGGAGLLTLDTPKKPVEGVETFDNGEGTNGRVASPGVVEGIAFSGVVLPPKLSGAASGLLANEGNENGGATLANLMLDLWRESDLRPASDLGEVMVEVQVLHEAGK